MILQNRRIKFVFLSSVAPTTEILLSFVNLFVKTLISNFGSGILKQNWYFCVVFSANFMKFIPPLLL